jgi:hypothetical protein
VLNRSLDAGAARAGDVVPATLDYPVSQDHTIRLFPADEQVQEENQRYCQNKKTSLPSRAKVLRSWKPLLDMDLSETLSASQF